MFKYVKYTKVTDEFTTHEFRGGSEEVKVNYFSNNIVSIESEYESKIDELISQQNSLINPTVISKEEFKQLAVDSLQVLRINKHIGELIARRYSYADEIAMMKKDITDEKRVEYEAYVEECKLKGRELKNSLGL